ncbi:MAG TPA: aspartate dehydrogenase [Candidatus Thermoplasmatota archaeon]|nr:aspartate dehydrogenase [Candidatus Thermoplasmatota archaeon]
MKVFILGCGAIGSEIAAGLEPMDSVTDVYLLDTRRETATALAARLHKARPVDTLKVGLEAADLVVEAASQQALHECAPEILRAGKDLIVLSVGALADVHLLNSLLRIATESGARLHVPSGAVGGLDLLLAAREAGLDEVTLTTAKPPRAVGYEEVDEETVLYEGPAREAVKKFPKNVNVAAAISLAGIGFENTRVRLTADPTLERNTHRITVRGVFGEMSITVSNEPHPKNPATSYLAPLAALALIRKLSSPLRVGT